MYRGGKCELRKRKAAVASYYREMLAEKCWSKSAALFFACLLAQCDARVELRATKKREAAR